MTKNVCRTPGWLLNGIWISVKSRQVICVIYLVKLSWANVLWVVLNKIYVLHREVSMPIRIAKFSRKEGGDRGGKFFKQKVIISFHFQLILYHRLKCVFFCDSGRLLGILLCRLCLDEFRYKFD